jgi:hypothetical protein
LTLAQLTQAINRHIVMSIVILINPQFDHISFNTYCR